MAAFSLIACEGDCFKHGGRMSNFISILSSQFPARRAASRPSADGETLLWPPRPPPHDQTLGSDLIWPKRQSKARAPFNCCWFEFIFKSLMFPQQPMNRNCRRQVMRGLKNVVAWFLGDTNHRLRQFILVDLPCPSDLFSMVAACQYPSSDLA